MENQADEVKSRTDIVSIIGERIELKKAGCSTNGKNRQNIGRFNRGFDKINMINMDWLFLFLAGLFEIGWPLGLKLSQLMTNKTLGIIIAAVSITASGLFLWLAQRTISIGTAYAVWTGIGAAGTFILGILIFKDSSDVFRILSVILIIMGVIGLKLSHQ